MNPEFLTEGRAVADFLSPDRLVLGANDTETHGVLSELYESVGSSVPRLLTNTRTAEMIKYASNALLATMISFSNEIADLCVAAGDIDVVDVMAGVHASEYLSPLSPRDGRIKAPITSFLEAGCGFGGSCLPKDLKAIIGEGERHAVALPVLRGALETNGARPHELIRALEEIGEIRGLRVTLLGVAFKPDTDDVRESPAVPIAEGLVAKGAVVTLHDPVVRVVPAPLEALGIGLEPDLATALAAADALVLVTSWDAYRELPELVSRAGLSPIVLDGRRMFDPSSFTRYVGIGRG
jgi:UDPglucose 6-dehydrogenase/GDP-mannose 6-dehydrogenase